MEGADDVRYEGAQYNGAGAAIRALLEAYPKLGRDRIVGHSDVAPGRKTDPGSAFEWAALRGAVGA